MEERRKNRAAAAWKAAKSNAKLKTGSIMLLVILLAMALAPVLATHVPTQLSSDVIKPPSLKHLLGTDGLGRDLYSMLLYGARDSIAVGFVSAAIAGVLGTLIGGFAGYFGGTVDRVISEVINIFLMIPTFFLVLVIVALYGSTMTNIMVIIGLTSWPSNARLMRVQALSLKERTFVKSAVAIGETRVNVFLRYIVPNGIYPVVANTALSVAGAILTEAGLSFLGLGDPTVISWGQIIYQGKIYLADAWWISGFAGISTIALVMSFYLIGDGLNIVLSPKLRKRG